MFEAAYRVADVKAVVSICQVYWAFLANQHLGRTAYMVVLLQDGRPTHSPETVSLIVFSPQLQFEKGDLITVTNKVEGGWWEGVCNGRVGWFPGNYAEAFSGGVCH